MSQISFGAGSCGLSDLNRGCVLDLGFVVWIELLDRDGIDSMMDTCWGTTDSKMAWEIWSCSKRRDFSLIAFGRSAKSATLIWRISAAWDRIVSWAGASEVISTPGFTRFLVLKSGEPPLRPRLVPWFWILVRWWMGVSLSDDNSNRVESNDDGKEQPGNEKVACIKSRRAAEEEWTRNQRGSLLEMKLTW